MGYVTGEIHTLPRGRRRGIVKGDDGTLYNFTWPSDWKDEHGKGKKNVWRGARVRGKIGYNKLLMGMRISKSTRGGRR